MNQQHIAFKADVLTTAPELLNVSGWAIAAPAEIFANSKISKILPTS